MTHRTALAGLNAPVSRRQVMIGAAGLSFAVALTTSGTLRAATLAGRRPPAELSPWVSIAADGTVTIMSPAAEMGQGSLTSIPLILAEELDADWTRVRIVPAPPVDAIYGNPVFGGMMYTAGSTAVRAYYQPVRMFGAQVRRVLLDNAARRWGVPVEELTTEPSMVVHAASGRRLRYGDIAAFAEVPAEAPEIAPEELKKPGDFRLIGTDVMRVDLPGKVDGSAAYSIDVRLPGMLYAAVVRAPVEGAAPDTVDDAAARAVPGVVDVVRLPYGVGVLAETAWAAFAGRQAVERQVTWTGEGKAWGFESDSGLEDFAAAARDPDAEIAEWSSAGDAPAELAGAAETMEAEYLCDMAYHAQMEPLNATAAVAPDGASVEIWCGTQSQSMASEATANALGISRDRVKLNDMLLGGGFGRRGPRDGDFVVDAVLLSKEAGRPVKVMWTREDDVRNGRFRPMSAHRLRAGFDAAGRITSWVHRIVGDRVTPFFDPIRYKGAGERDFILMLGSDIAGYAIPHQRVEQIYRETGMRTAPLRGIGFTANKFAAEAFIDEIGRARGADPVAFRLELLRDDARGRTVVERVAAMADWGRKRDGRGLGFGYLNYSESRLAAAAEISLDRDSGDIKVHDFWCAIDCGVPVQPDNVAAQTESSIVYGVGLSLMERISARDGAVQESNFFDYFVPRMNQVPAMHVEVVATDNAPSGAGQMATPLVAPVIASAVADLAGVRLRHTPFTPERVKAALG